MSEPKSFLLLKVLSFMVEKIQLNNIHLGKVFNLFYMHYIRELYAEAMKDK